MSGFDTVLVVDWSAGRRSPPRPSSDAIWMGTARAGLAQEPVYLRSRIEAEAWLSEFFAHERAAGRRVLTGFDFPFGYPQGFARTVTGSDDPLALWTWLEARISDDARGVNNRFEVAEAINARFAGPGPFWGKTHFDRWPGIPYRKAGIVFDAVPEWRACDRAARAASSCFQLAFPPTVGSQALMGLPVLERLRRLPGVAVWPFQDWTAAPVVLAEIWPGLIEPAVKARMTPGAIRDREQVRALSLALARMTPEALEDMLRDTAPEAAEEAWVLGAGHAETLAALCQQEAA
ncbi:MAG TPA: hypothetical protein DEA05_02095 [Rhodobacteraceae bacterium]|nr:hypothetical protein [Paracoccaceae bacterium]